MSEILCAVCHKGKGPEKCEVCGFSDNRSINRQFLIFEDVQNWIDTVVHPYHIQWVDELLAQREEADKKIQTLTQQLSGTHLRNTAPPVKKFPVVEFVVGGGIGLVIGFVIGMVIMSIKPPPPPPPPPPPIPTPISQVPFVRINGGTFIMGSPANEPDRSGNEVRHQVKVSDFYMGEHEVTQEEWQKVMGTYPSKFKGDNLPVENVSWYDAIDYCNKMSENEDLTPAYTVIGKSVTWNREANGYRLPTEAEWEYACKAKIMTPSPFSTGDNITTGQANYNGNYPYNNNAKGEYREKTTPVRSFAPNELGLYDMHGNVWEWCWDWYGDYSSSPQTDPEGASSGSHRVLRGGGWVAEAQFLRSAYRGKRDPSDLGGSDIGFRLVRSSL